MNQIEVLQGTTTPWLPKWYLTWCYHIKLNVTIFDSKSLGWCVLHVLRCKTIQNVRSMTCKFMGILRAWNELTAQNLFVDEIWHDWMRLNDIGLDLTQFGEIGWDWILTLLDEMTTIYLFLSWGLFQADKNMSINIEASSKSLVVFNVMSSTTCNSDIQSHVMPFDVLYYTLTFGIMLEHYATSC